MTNTGIGRIFAGIGLAASIAAQLGAAASAQAPAPPRAAPAAPPAASAIDDGYVLGPADVIEATVLGRDDYKARVRVQSDGSVQLPLIGRVVVTGRTPLTLSAEVARLLRAGGYFEKPVVNIDVSSYASRYVTVLGEVGQPGLVPVDRSYRVSEILARVGGVKESAADHVTLRRVNGEEQQLLVVTLATGAAADDPVVNPGDKLFAPAAKMFYIYGQVKSPGTFRLDADMSIRKALARSGGLTASGSEKRVKVFRNGQEIKGVSLNAPVIAGDVIVVGERFF